MKVVVFVSLLAVCSRAQDYCSICKEHTACSYKGPSSVCGNERESGLLPGDIPTIVQEHNNYRSKVARGEESRGKPGPQPAASNMSYLSWDPELATIAQFWADQCHFGHDECRNVQRFYVGQNVFMSMGSGKKYSSDWPKAIMAWYNEVAKFSSKEIAPFRFSEDIGHYSQMVWDITYKIGCGFTVYKDEKRGTYNKYYVCNYGPGGNVISGTMYKTGETCRACPNRCNVGLCGAQLEPLVNASIPEEPQFGQPTQPRPPAPPAPIQSRPPAPNPSSRPTAVQQPPENVQQPIPPYYYPFSHWYQHYYWPYQNWQWYW